MSPEKPPATPEDGEAPEADAEVVEVEADADDSVEAEVVIVDAADDDEEDEDDDEEEEVAKEETKPAVPAAADGAAPAPRPTGHIQPGRPPSAKEEPPPPFAVGERVILTQNTRPRTGTPIGDYAVGSQGRVETVLSQTAIVRFDIAPDTKEVVAFTCLISAEPDRPKGEPESGGAPIERPPVERPRFSIVRPSAQRRDGQERRAETAPSPPPPRPITPAPPPPRPRDRRRPCGRNR